MSSSSTESGTSPPPIDDDHDLIKPVSELAKRAKPGRPTQKSSSESTPLIIAAYRYGDPYHKRRVKVPAHITWSEFLALLASRLDVRRECDIATYDENGIEIVSVEDLVPNDVLVVKERPVADYARASHYTRSKHSDDRGQSASLRQPEDAHSVAVVTRSKPHPLPPTGTPLLTHFIKANNFGYYFLAEVDYHRGGGGRGGGGGGGGGGGEERKRTHCIVKVPSCDKSSDTSRIFEMEATLLRKVCGHRSIVATPTVQILNFANKFLQLFFSHLPEHKQPPLTELFFSGTCSEAYIYPLYGVTMATKIKTGLSPEKAVRYAYQLADTLYYLQQRGVIHQTLLPENIQVMSNDRVIICNFETAVQTDPATCTLLITHNVIAPSNRMGLAPEVLNAFNRGDAEVIDYSTQYPWSFGSLSVHMATGQHPLRNYPGRYLTETKVKYRSHNYQSLPDASKYPSLFCRLVKRSLSCDPLRRPSLFQITSIMKKDTRTLTMMSLSTKGKASSVISSPGTVSRSNHSTRDHMELERSEEQDGTVTMYGHSRHRHRSLVSSPPPPPPLDQCSLAHEQTSPLKRTKMELQQQTLPLVNEYSCHLPRQPTTQDAPRWSHDGHVTSTYQNQRSHDRSHDPAPPSQQFSRSYDGSRQCSTVCDETHQVGSNWSDVGVRTATKISPRVSRTLPERGTANSRSPLTPRPIPQQGGFSDDFNPLLQNSSPSVRAGSADITQSQSSVRYAEVVRALQEQRLSRKRSSATSDSDGNGMLTADTEYQPLLPEDSAEDIAADQVETETSRTAQPGKTEENITQICNDPGSISTPARTSSARAVCPAPARWPQLRIKSYEASRRSLRRPSEPVQFRRVSSLQPSIGSNPMSSSLGSRQCFSDSETRSFSNPVLSTHTTIPSWNISTLKPRGMATPLNITPALPISRDDSTSNDDDTLQRDVVRTDDNVLERGRAGEVMQVSPVTTHAFEISDKSSDVSTRAEVGANKADHAASASGTNALEGSVPSTDVGSSLAGSDVRRLPQETPQSGVQPAENDHPQGNELLMECENHKIEFPQSGGSVCGNEQSGVPSTVVEPQPTGNNNPLLPLIVDSQWNREKQLAEGSRTDSAVHEPSQPSTPPSSTVTTAYSGPHIMSPIAEVSQEVSTQQTNPQHFSASQTQHTQFTQSMHSVSPTPEQSHEPELRRSTSPFQHNALGDAVSTALSPTSVSDSTSITSQVARAVRRSLTPQLEPPSTSSETSHSLTRSSEVNTAAQTMVYSAATTSVDHDRTTTPTNATASACQTPYPMLQHTVTQNPGAVSKRLSEITQTHESGSVVIGIQSQQIIRPEATEYDLSVQANHRAESQGYPLQSSGTYQSTISNGSSRERHSGRGTTPWSTASAPPPVGSYTRHGRRNRRLSSPSGAQSAVSDNAAIQFRTTRKNSHSNQSSDQSDQRSLHGHRRHRGSTGASGGLRHNHSAQRISQDLEMMTRAIEGMDTERPLEGDRDGGTRDERLQLSSSHSPSPSPTQPAICRAVTSSSRGTRYPPNVCTDLRTATHPARPESVAPTSYSQQSSRRNHVPVDPHRHQVHNFHFRHSPNPPNSLTGLSQIPPNNDSPDPIRQEVDTQNLAQSARPLTQGEVLSPVQFPSAIPMEDDRLLSQRGPNVLPPPPPGANSHEYLPPYSPPATRPEENSTSRTSHTHAAVVQEDGPVYPDPPPSYEEIFGQQSSRKQRQRQRRTSRPTRRREDEGAGHVVGGESQSQQDHHSSRHRSSRTSGHRRLPSLTSLFKRSRRHTHDPHTGHSGGHRSNGAQPHELPNLVPIPVPDTPDVAPSGDRYHAESPEPTTLQRTASWVASYSQTPRPITAYQQLEHGFRDFRTGGEISSARTAIRSTTGHNQVSRAVSDTTSAITMHQVNSSHSQPTHTHHQTLAPTQMGLPSYRHPPPFLHMPLVEPASTTRLAVGYNLSPQDSYILQRQTVGNSQDSDSPRQANTARGGQLPQRQTSISQNPNRHGRQPQALGGTVSAAPLHRQASNAQNPSMQRPTDPTTLPSQGQLHYSQHPNSNPQSQRPTDPTTLPSQGQIHYSQHPNSNPQSQRPTDPTTLPSQGQIHYSQHPNSNPQSQRPTDPTTLPLQGQTNYSQHPNSNPQSQRPTDPTTLPSQGQTNYSQHPNSNPQSQRPTDPTTLPSQGQTNYSQHPNSNPQSQRPTDPTTLPSQGQTNYSQHPNSPLGPRHSNSTEDTLSRAGNAQDASGAHSQGQGAMTLSRPLSRSRANHINLSQPNINTITPGSHGDTGSTVSASNNPHQGPIFRRVLANPQRTRPVSSLVTSVEYGRVGTSMTSVLSTLISEANELRGNHSMDRLCDNERVRDQMSLANTRDNQTVSQEASNEQLQAVAPRQPFLPWQLDAQKNNEGSDETLAANGNANNSSPTSPQGSPNATPRSSPIVRRRALDQVTSDRNEITENGVSENGNEITGTRPGGDKPRSLRSTQRSRAASRRLAQQLSSSEEDLVAGSSSSLSSHGRVRPRGRKRGDGSSRSSSRQESQSQNSPCMSPHVETPAYFPSFQSQTTELPHDSIFSTTVSSDMTIQNNSIASDAVGSHGSHMMTRDSHVMTHQSEVQDVHVCGASQQAESHDFATTEADISPDQPITPLNTVQREMSLEVSHDHPALSPERSHDLTSDATAVDIHTCVNTTEERSGSATPGTALITSGETTVPASPLSTSKPCGHVCVGGGQLEACCRCVQSLDSITDLFQSCEICESRRSLGCNCTPDTLNNKFCPVHGARGQSSPPDVPHSSHSHYNRKHIKNCIVM